MPRFTPLEYEYCPCPPDAWARQDFSFLLITGEGITEPSWLQNPIKREGVAITIKSLHESDENLCAGSPSPPLPSQESPFPARRLIMMGLFSFFLSLGSLKLPSFPDQKEITPRVVINRCSELGQPLFCIFGIHYGALTSRYDVWFSALSSAASYCTSASRRGRSQSKALFTWFASMRHLVNVKLRC